MERDCGPNSVEQIYQRVFRELRPRTALRQVKIDFRKYTNIQSFVEFREGILSVRMSDIFAGVDRAVHESLAHVLISKMFRRAPEKEHVRRYQRFLANKYTLRTAEQLRKDRGYKRVLPPAGKVYDLVLIFEELNFRHFHGLMSRPALGWSTTPSRSILGHYDPAHHTIVISQLLDREDVPRSVVDYVVYHEMLHLRYPTEYRKGRRCVHTAEFKAAEDRFPEVEEAKAALNLICRKAGQDVRPRTARRQLRTL